MADFFRHLFLLVEKALKNEPKGGCDSSFQFQVISFIIERIEKLDGIVTSQGLDDANVKTNIKII